jgi:hypothetical protein
MQAGASAQFVTTPMDELEWVESDTADLPPPRPPGGRGLLDLQDPFPLAPLHLQLPVDAHVVLEQGKGTFGAVFNWANSFGLSEGNTIMVDAETYRLRLNGWYGLFDDFYVGASVAIHARDSGIMDPFVDEFHKSFGLGDGDRSARSRNDYELSVTDADGKVASLDRGAGIGDLVLQTHWNLYRGGPSGSTIAVQGLIALPTSTDEFGQDGVDFGLNLSLSKELIENFYLYVVVGGTALTDARTAGLRYEPLNYQVIAGVEFAVLDNLSLLAQAQRYSPLLERPGVLADERTYLSVGGKWEFSPGREFQFGFMENLDPFKNSADVAFSVGVEFSN